MEMLEVKYLGPGIRWPWGHGAPLWKSSKSPKSPNKYRNTQVRFQPDSGSCGSVQCDAAELVFSVQQAPSWAPSWIGGFHVFSKNDRYSTQHVLFCEHIPL